MSQVTVVLGRDGLGDGTEEEFREWVVYVFETLEEECCVSVHLSEREQDDEEQTDAVIAEDEFTEKRIVDALNMLWDSFCEENLPQTRYA